MAASVFTITLSSVVFHLGDFGNPLRRGLLSLAAFDLRTEAEVIFLIFMADESEAPEREDHVADDVALIVHNGEGKRQNCWDCSAALEKPASPQPASRKRAAVTRRFASYCAANLLRRHPANALDRIGRGLATLQKLQANQHPVLGIVPRRHAMKTVHSQIMLKPNPK